MMNEARIEEPTPRRCGRTREDRRDPVRAMSPRPGIYRPSAWADLSTRRHRQPRRRRPSSRSRRAASVARSGSLSQPDPVMAAIDRHESTVTIFGLIGRAGSGPPMRAASSRSPNARVGNGRRPTTAARPPRRSDTPPPAHADARASTGTRGAPQGLDHSSALVLTQPTFFTAFAALCRLRRQTEGWLAALHHGFRPVCWHVSRCAIRVLRRVLAGQEAPRARWRGGSRQRVLGQPWAGSTSSNIFPRRRKHASNGSSRGSPKRIGRRSPDSTG